MEHHLFAPTGFYTGIVTEHYYETWQFYTEVLGFQTWEESDDHVLLAHASGARLMVLQHETSAVAPQLVSGTNGSGFWFVIEVAELDSEYARLCELRAEGVHPPELSIQGRRAFTVRDPNGVLVCICERQSSPSEMITAAERW